MAFIWVARFCTWFFLQNPKTEKEKIKEEEEAILSDKLNETTFHLWSLNPIPFFLPPKWSERPALHIQFRKSELFSTQYIIEIENRSTVVSEIQDNSSIQREREGYHYGIYKLGDHQSERERGVYRQNQYQWEWGQRMDQWLWCP